MPFALLGLALGARGVVIVWGRWAPKRPGIWGRGVVVAALVAVFSLPSLAWTWRLARDGPSAVTQRIHVCLAAVSPQIRPGERLLAADIGAVGFYWPQAEVVDLNGLVSRTEWLGLQEGELVRRSEPNLALLNASRHGLRTLERAGVAEDFVAIEMVGPSRVGGSGPGGGRAVCGVGLGLRLASEGGAE